MVKNWRAEAASTPTANVSKPMLDYLIAELRHEATMLERTSMFNAYNIVAISDLILSASFRDSFNKAGRPLENVPEPMKDWHPESDGKILNLLDPSLFPLIYGRTRVLESTEEVALSEAVPCQRADWWRQGLEETEQGSTANQLNKLPLELQDDVFGAVEDFPISLEQAQGLRLELMEERKDVQVKQNRALIT